MLRKYIILLVLLFGSLFAISCQSPIQEGVESAATTIETPSITPTIAVTSTSTATLKPPLVQLVKPKATDLPLIELPSVEELATATPEPTLTNTPLPTEMPTALPSFTPPALPGTSLNEHYWFYRPVAEGGTVWTDKSYQYGSTRDGTLRPHHGVEFQVGNGAGVYAPASGTVVVAGSDSETVFGEHKDFYGNLVVVEHDSKYKGQPLFTLYGHLSQVGVVTGQRVEAGNLLGLSGAAGVADGSHLHFEVRVGRNSYDATRNPALWLYPFSEHGTVAGRVTFPNGVWASGALVTATRLDAPSAYKGTTTYIGQTVNADNGWNENFVIDDVKAGYYVITVIDGNKRYKTEAWVHALQTTFVEIEIPLP